FSCALVSDILLQGTLYITPNFFAFYSKIFGHVSRLLIPVTQVAGIQKERTAKIIPNAVGLQMLDGKSYVFGSLLSRDSTYKLMLHIWKKAQRLADSDSEPPSAVQVAGEEDDGEDSVSGSAESLMEEDQTDSGYLASSPISAVTAVATGATVPWTRDTSSTTTITTTTTAILPGPDICTSSSTSIPLSNLTSSQNPVTLRQGGLSVVKGVGASIPEEPGGAAGVGDGLIHDGMYEEVLQMQQRLHAAASTEIEKTLSIQLKHIATVRQSLEALVVLFNKEPPMNTARIPDNT
ncbi:GRAM domain-containing protein, partial [Homarus americanus]